jgi:acyl carrier protein
MEMTEHEIIQGLAKLVEEFTDVPGSAVTPEASLREDLAIDSLSMVEIVVAALENYGVEISDDELKDVRTVQDVVDFVQRSKVSV